jgi:hypothetical protein
MQVLELVGVADYVYADDLAIVDLQRRRLYFAICFQGNEAG